MRERVLGWTGVHVPVIGQGTWAMENDDRAACIAALREGISAGMTHIDTAEMYGDGVVEQAIVAKAIAGRRDEVFLTSKVLPQKASFEGTLAACERSLRRLGTDYLDLYLLHWRGPHPLAQTLAAFERLVDERKIRFFGVSNFDVDDIEEAVQVAGPNRLVCDQVLYHLEERTIEYAVLPECERRRMAMVGYSPLGHGRFPSPRTAGGRVLGDIARRHDATPRQVALAFLLRRPGSFTIPKASSPAHALENAGAGDLSLSPDDSMRIDAAFDIGPPSLTLPVL